MMEKPEYFPTIFQSIILLILYTFVFTMVPWLFLISLAPLLGFNQADLLVETTARVLGFVLLIFWINRRYRLEISGFLSVKNMRFAYILPVVIVVIGAGILFSELDNLLKLLFAGSEGTTEVVEGFTGAWSGFWKPFLTLVFLLPVLEEVIFRGIILKGLLKHHPPHRALAVSSLLFGFMYLQTWQFWGIISWGVIAGWWYYRTRTLIPCILGRVLLNSLSLIGVGLFGLEIPGFTTAYRRMVFQPWWFDCLGILLLVSGIILMVKLFRRNDNLKTRVVSSE